MRRAAVVVLLLAFMLAGCTHEPIILLDNDVAQVSRSGREIHVSDVSSGEQYNFTITRVKRNTGEVSREYHVGNLTVLTAPSTMVICGDGHSWIIHF